MRKQICRITIGVLLLASYFILKKYSLPETSIEKNQLNEAPAVETLQQKEKPKEQNPKHFKERSASLPSELRQFKKLKKKVLLSSEEAKEREKYLSNPKIVQWTSKALSHSPLDLKTRFLLIDFLEEALVWKENPVRKDVIAAIQEVISTQTQILSQEEKRESLGDQIELFTILSQEAPEAASAFVLTSHGTKIEPILEYARKRFFAKSRYEE